MKRSPHFLFALAIILALSFVWGAATAQTPAWNANSVSFTASVGCVSGPANGCPVTGYRVERAASQTGTYAAVGTTSASPFVHTNAAAGVNCYRVVALSAAGNSAPSVVTSAACVTNVEPSGPPNAPSNVTVTVTIALAIQSDTPIRVAVTDVKQN